MGRVQLYLFVAVLGMMQAGLEVLRDGGDTFQRNAGPTIGNDKIGILLVQLDFVCNWGHSSPI